MLILISGFDDCSKSDEKPFFEDAKTSLENSDESSNCIKPKANRPRLLVTKSTYRAHLHHFQR